VSTYTTLAKDFEFNGSSLPVGWSAGNRFNWGFAATEWMSSQVSMTGSSTALTAIQHASPDGYPNESGWVSTSGGGYSFQYGIVDYRAKMPAGQGLWSGFWMLSSGSSTTGEIDVAEQLLANLRTVYGSAHAWNGSTQLWGKTQAGSLTSDATGWHDYQLIWQPGLLTWAIDGVAYAQYSQAQAQAAGQTWTFNTQSMYLIADLAVAGQNEWGGGLNSSTVLPASLQLASVKIWQ
jgi:beta-glucanase (GH16 family)